MRKGQSSLKAEVNAKTLLLNTDELEGLSKDIKDLVTAIKDTDGIKKITDAVSIDNPGGIGYEVVGVKDSGDVRIDPATEGGNLSDIKEKTDNLDVALSAIFGVESVYDSFVDPESSPVLTLDTKSKPYLEFWIKSIVGGATVNIYGSRDNTSWRLVDSLTTDVTTKEVHNGYVSGYQYVKVEIVETETGTSEIEITAQR